MFNLLISAILLTSGYCGGYPGGFNQFCVWNNPTITAKTGLEYRNDGKLYANYTVGTENASEETKQFLLIWSNVKLPGLNQETLLTSTVQLPQNEGVFLYGGYKLEVNFSGGAKGILLQVDQPSPYAVPNLLEIKKVLYFPLASFD